jgi:lysozyme
MGQMQISDAGYRALIGREGRVYKAYQDIRGIWTIGIGHTGPEVHEGLVWTDQQIDEAFKKDTAWAAAEVNRMVTVPMTKNQFDALSSFTYNIGKTGFDHSSALLAFNTAVMTAANDLLKWEQPPSLKGRRESERAQFLTPDPS